MSEPLRPAPPDWPEFLAVPQAVVQQQGRWMCLIYIKDGGMRYGPNGYGWHRFGFQRAHRKARSELAKYLLDRDRRAQVWTIGGDDDE